MRMHRGSSKDARAPARTTETLPLSASSLPTCEVVVELTRGRAVERRSLRVAPGTSVRAALREAGHPAEGSAVFVGEMSIPLDTPIDRSVTLVVVPTFSGG